jgi:O-methyltransferase
MYFLKSKIVDLVLNFWQRVPGPVIHNLEKARMLKKLFWHLNVDGIEGDYFEFGVAHGNSMRAAELAVKHSHFNSLGVKHITRNLYGFDTFENFIGGGVIDNHPIWEGNLFSVPEKLVKRRFRRSRNVHLFKLDANLLDPELNEYEYSRFGIKRKAAIILFDMDLYGPTKSALTWVTDLIQQGTFLVFDEYFSFGGDQGKGEARALIEFVTENSNLILRDFGTYGVGGKIFVVDLVK